MNARHRGRIRASTSRSVATISCPRPRRCGTRCRPTNPDAPVTSTRTVRRLPDRAALCYRRTRGAPCAARCGSLRCRRYAGSPRLRLHGEDRARARSRAHGDGAAPCGDRLAPGDRRSRPAPRGGVHGTRRHPARGLLRQPAARRRGRGRARAGDPGRARSREPRLEPVAGAVRAGRPRRSRACASGGCARRWSRTRTGASRRCSAPPASGPTSSWWWTPTTRASRSPTRRSFAARSPAWACAPSGPSTLATSTRSTWWGRGRPASRRS